MGKVALERADRIAQGVVKRLSPHCSRIEVAGSVRRRKPWVNDIDFVLVPSDLWALHAELVKIGRVKMSGQRIIRVMFDGIQIDIYVASEETWGMILLVRTGSVEHNMKMVARAKSRGYHFSVARGVEDENGRVIASKTEEDIFESLGLDYIPPEKRI